MPLKLFDYVCNSCDELFEAFNDVEKCPACKSKRIEVKPTYSGYKIKGDNSASTTPSQGAAFRRKKK